MKRFLSCIQLIALIALVAAPVFSANPRDELKGVKQEIKAKKRIISKTRKIEAVVSNELQEINRNLEQKKTELGKLDRDLRKVEINLAKTRREITAALDETERKKREITKRLSSLYKAGNIGLLRMVFSSESLSSVSETTCYMKAVVEYDKKIFDEYNQKMDELHSLKNSLEQEANRKESIKRGIASKKNEIEQEKDKKSAYLKKVRNDRASQEASLKELNANAARLQSMLAKLEAANRRKASRTALRQTQRSKDGKKTTQYQSLPPVPDRGFLSQKGRMSLPVRGQIIENYGKHKHPDFDSYTFSKGLSISAAPGTSIRSIYDGTVIFADYFKGYGNMVIVDHGGGYFSLYAHASKILKRVGAQIAKNDVLATVGDVDSLKGPLLYFEIRRQGKPLDPSGWVR